jgi:chemotaxis response regulator CheB
LILKEAQQRSEQATDFRTSKLRGYTIAQSSSVIFGMPHEAIQLGAVQHVLDICDIAPSLLKATHASSLSQR